MSPEREQDRYIPGVPCWVDTAQPDPEAAMAFYGALFGWTFEDVLPAAAPERYAIAHLPGGTVGAITSAEGGAGASWRTYVRVWSADDAAARVLSAGGRVLAEPQDVGEAGRMAVCADREGAELRLWEARARMGASVVNEHGSLNFNDLHTGDPDGAAAFYGAVFGWERLDLGEGAMWALPAYGDFLEERQPGLRARLAEAGAPERFDEVVASMAPAGADPGATPHWGVTFAVDDADLVARRAVELGGRVEVEPMDLPWVRLTVITDPQGATFTASKYAPENKDVAVPAQAAAA